MSDYVSFQQDDFRWQVAPQLRDVLFESGEIATAKWNAQNCVHVVKQANHRTVLRVTLPEMHFYLKHYPKSDVRAWFRQLVRPSKARIEYDKAVEIAARGIPTIAPLAIGERAAWLGSGESYLVTQEIENAVPLYDFLTVQFPALSTALQTRFRKRLANNLGVFMANLHNSGIRHEDLHAGNVLLRLGADEEPLLFLIDLHAVIIGGPLDWTASCDNLVLCNRWFSFFAERSDRARFWRAYCCHRTLTIRSYDLRCRAKQLEQTTWRSNVHFCRRRDRRCTKTNRHFRRVRSGAGVGFAVADLDPDFVNRLAANPDAPFSEESARILKHSSSSTIAEIEAPLDGQIVPMVWKRIPATKWHDGWKALMRRSAVWRSWMFGHGLLNRGIPTARPLLVLHRRRAGWLGHGYLLTEKIDNAQELHRFLDSLDHASPKTCRRQKQNVIDRLAVLIRNLHRWCFSHRDLKAANILVRSGNTSGAELAVWLIDLVGIRRWKEKVPRKRRVHDLARLNASCLRRSVITRTDRLRFLRSYLECGWKGRQSWKTWWNAIAKATERKVAKNKKRGRILA